jgi:hypothetical protein
MPERIGVSLVSDRLDVEAAYQSIKSDRAVRLPLVPEPVAVAATTR